LKAREKSDIGIERFTSLYFLFSRHVLPTRKQQINDYVNDGFDAFDK